MSRRALPRGTRIACAIDSPATRRVASRRGITRSAAAVELWGDSLAGGVAAIGNAPTALRALLERLSRSEAARPSAIVAFPVGFVDAAESKEALLSANLGIPAATIRGRRGGSAMAAAVINAAALLLREEAGRPLRYGDDDDEDDAEDVAEDHAEDDETSEDDPPIRRDRRSPPKGFRDCRRRRFVGWFDADVAVCSSRHAAATRGGAGRRDAPVERRALR